ncbi:hypothetical protein HOD83_00100 [Candidatus Woesearchaeota archaeon]|jgi:hypothetical protein|nr:hypothetical protein [Candidatus Woesearchaeota archaeon]MBT4247981.1 hypothetical protein [Candidatus Woesearchaeota archaeon]
MRSIPLSLFVLGLVVVISVGLYVPYVIEQVGWTPIDKPTVIDVESESGNLFFTIDPKENVTNNGTS